MYREWTDILPGHVEMLGVRYPGRETLMREPPVNDMHALVGALRDAIEPLLDLPFAFFGHSMGSWVAFELARDLRRAARPKPEMLFVSARRAPDVEDRFTRLGHLDDRALVAGVQERYGGIPEAVLRESELLELLLPALRADLQLLDDYVFSQEEPLGCPIVAFGGDKDSQVSVEDLQAWHCHTSRSFQQHLLRGSHFYLHESDGRRLRAQIGEAMRRKSGMKG